jgi:hypothetical protein
MATSQMQSERRTCPFCGSMQISGSETCLECGAPLTADPDHSLTENIIGPIDQIFLLNPSNRAAAMGVSRRIGGVKEQFDATAGAAMTFFLGAVFALIVLCLVIVVALQVGGAGALAIVVLGLGFGGFGTFRLGQLAWRALVNGQRNRRLGTDGQLLAGEVVSARWKYFRRRRRVPVLQYRFSTADGRTLTAEQPGVPNPLHSAPKELPAPGTPVAVMYADDTCYKVL